jgi:phosphatidylserine/phosphatidylglycerophosphate/cardiolipin synthase-like enzyme/uncharacterized membrane protein YdjX (TVP38/TMEM64 family)
LFQAFWNAKRAAEFKRAHKQERWTPLTSLFEPSKNCYKVAHADRAAFLVDGADYFRAVRDAMRRAKHSIIIVGWDLHSELRLVRDDTEDGHPQTLGKLLDDLAAGQPDLHIYLLCWDFAMIYAMEREFFPRYKLKWRTHKRLHYCLDGHHPVGASQHQKLVVIDDRLAFAGGLDLSQWRWDTSEHLPDDSRRRDPAGEAYPPFHDVQMTVDAGAARVLGQLARQRWERAAGSQPVAPVKGESEDPWPETITPDLKDVRIAVARTMPAFEDQPAVREVEQLYLDSIAAARRFIYIENQYLSAHRVSEALKQRLQESEGPDVVIVLPEKTGGWLEQHTMDVLRGRILKKLRSADRHDRLRIYYPRLAADPHCSLMVHAKVMVIDDDLVRVGSSNLSNRSMGLDSECDLALEAGGNEDIRQVIAGFRNRLIAEHLDTSADAVAGAVENHGSAVKAIEAMRGGKRTLEPLSDQVPEEVDQWVPESELLDPEKPVEPDELVDHFISPDQQPSAYRHLLKVIILLACVVGLAALWRWTPANQWLNVASAMAVAEWIRQQPLSPLLVLAVHVAGGLVVFPVTLMIIATVIVFGPWWGPLYSLLGATLSALVTFGAGHFIGREAVRRISGSLVNRLSRKLSRSGLLTVITLRIVPVAPFSVINMIAGVSHIRLKDFLLGTVIGMLPGITAIAVLADRIAESLKQPDLGSFAALGAALAAVGLGLVGLRYWIKRQRDQN